MKRTALMVAGVVALAMPAGVSRSAPDGAAANDSKLVREAQKRELAATKEVIDRLAKRAELVALTPEFLSERHQWAHRVVELELLLADDDAARQKAASDYLAEERANGRMVRDIINNDDKERVVRIEEAYVAEAQTLQAGIKAEMPARLPPLGPVAKERMEDQRRKLEAAKLVLDAIDKKERIVALTPEFAGMQEHWALRVVELELSSTEGKSARREVAERFLGRTQAMRRRIENQTDEAPVWLAGAYVAKAETLVARVKAGESAVIPAPAASNSAAAPQAVLEARWRELEAAKAALQEIEKAKDGAVTDEYVAMRLRWIARVAKLELSLTHGNNDRQKVAQDLVASAKAYRDFLKGRLKIDVDAITMNMAQAFVVDAEVLLERVRAGEDLADELE